MRFFASYRAFQAILFAVTLSTGHHRNMVKIQFAQKWLFLKHFSARISKMPTNFTFLKTLLPTINVQHFFRQRQHIFQADACTHQLPVQPLPDRRKFAAVLVIVFDCLFLSSFVTKQ